MKVLLISHTVLSKTSNMGKTLLSYFGALHPDEIAQLYIHSEVPTDDSVCRNYYRFTDTDALKSIIPLHKHGRSFSAEDIQTERVSSRTDTGVKGKIYQFGRQRTGAIYLARNTMWSMSHWFTKELKQWLDDFAPDIIFFASGDYAFMYNVARKIADYLDKPMVASCMDDYYLYSENEKNWIGRFEHKMFLRTVRKTMQRTACIFTICDSMKAEYEKLFHRPTYTLYTSARKRSSEQALNPDAKQISYIGNLGYGRDRQLIAIGKALKALGRTEEPLMLDVYSGEKNPEVLQRLTPENGIRFHGQVSSDEVLRIMQNSMAVIHTESFDETTKRTIRFSVSTKIAESLMCGPCLLVYGPEGIASVDYLEANDAAYVITNPEDLQTKLAEFLADDAKRAQILKNARRLGSKNHDVTVVSEMLKQKLQSLCAADARA